MAWKKLGEAALVVAAVGALTQLGDWVAHMAGVPPIIGQMIGGSIAAMVTWLRQSPWAKPWDGVDRRELPGSIQILPKPDQPPLEFTKEVAKAVAETKQPTI